MLWPFAPVFISLRGWHGWPRWGPCFTDLLLNAYYDMAFQWYQLGNYLGYALLIGLGRWMHRSAHWSRLLSAGILEPFVFI